jgi:hypothetical protein
MTYIQSSERSGGEDGNRDQRPGGWRARLEGPWWLLAALALGALGGRVVPFVSVAAADPIDGQLGGKTCDSRILRGNYGFSFSGSFTGGEPYTGVGSESCDDKGHCTGVTTINVDGTTSTAPFTAEYTIYPDCTGIERANYYELGLVINETVTIVDGGREVHFMGTDPGGTVLGVMKRR